MKKPISIHIPTPCHENWQQMTPVDKGRFCQSCAKQVIDFSMMTDQQILTHIAKASGGTCGRFADDQLQRPLQPIQKEKKKLWWIAATMPLLMLFEKAAAQKKDKQEKKISIVADTTQLMIMGMIGLPDTILGEDKTAERVIYGTVINTTGQPVPFASIKMNGINVGASANVEGGFTITTPKRSGTNFIEVSSIGYKTQKVFITNDRHDYTIVLQAAENMLQPVVLTCNSTTKGKVDITGSIVTVSAFSVTSGKPTLFDTLKSILNPPPFKVSPNPVTRGSSITVDVKNEGTYSIQLFSNTGSMVLVRDFEAAESGTQTSLNIPSSLAAGLYYIRLVDNKKKKQYTDKIIVL